MRVPDFPKLDPWRMLCAREALPVVDADGRIKAVFTQGDFVSYTWPDLIYQMRSIATATVTKNWHYFIIGGGIALYSIIMIIVLGTMGD
jgi:predicted membrane channel-forming protein YqfA (hemolysin III family)